MLSILIAYWIATGLYGFFLLTDRKGAFRLAQVLVSLGFVGQTFWLVQRWVSRGAVPLASLFEILLFLSWSVMLLFFLLSLRYRFRLLGGLIYAAVSSLLLVAFFLDHEIRLTPQIFTGAWPWVHAVCLVLSYGAFAIACISGIVYLIEEQQIKTKHLIRMYPWLPSLDALDGINDRSVAIGFILLTVGMGLGLLNASRFWGSFWQWDAKTISTMVMWAAYAVLLQLRRSATIRGKKAAWVSVMSFGMVLFTFLGVRYLAPTLHTYF